MGARIVHEALEVDAWDTSINEKNLEWHREARGYKVRYVPTTLPDLLKTEAVAEYEFNRYGSGKIDQSVRDNQLLLLQQRHPGSELETCMPQHHLEAFAYGEGIWRDLPVADRRAQLQRMIDLNEELYPGFRWFLYDGKETYSISMTIFGPMRVSLFLGKLYVIVNNIDHIRRITDRFDDLIRMAVVHPHEIRDYLQGLLQHCE